MTARPGFYLTGTATAASTVTLTVDAGNVGATAGYDLWNDKGAVYGDTTTLSDVRLSAEVWDGTAWVTSGLPAVDESWFRVRVTAATKTGDSTMTDQTTGFAPVGVANPFVLGDVPKNCARTIEVYLNVPAGATAGANLPRLRLIYEEASEATAALQTIGSGAGVIPDWLLDGVRRITRGRTVTGAGTAVVTVAAGSFAYDGVPYTCIPATATLNQNDVTPAALAAGESYKAVLSQKSDKTVTATKGTKAVSPTVPATPAGEIYLCTVNVAYQSGGTSVINTSDIVATSCHRGEYLVEAGTGLNVTIGAGQALTAAATRTFRGAASSAACTDATTNYIWLRIDGGFSANTTGVAPEFGAIPLATVVTAAGAITTITDTRPWARPVEPLELRYTGAITAASATDSLTYALVPYDCDCADIDFNLGLNGTAASGSTQVELMTFAAGAAVAGAGTTIYTGKATSDQRPSIAYNATMLRAATQNHEVRQFTKGQRVALYVTAVPVTATVDPADAIVTMYLRKR